ncbi:hypothetical protein DFAR_2210020 [Desulfarculales bacterium]
MDVWQVGARNCFNYFFLDVLAHVKYPRPVMLKRGDHVSLEEPLGAALRVYEGNPQVILCERGDKISDRVRHNVLNLNNVAFIKQNYHLPVIVGSSHGSGVRKLMPDLDLAAGDDGLMVGGALSPREGPVRRPPEPLPRF